MNGRWTGPRTAGSVLARAVRETVPPIHSQINDKLRNPIKFDGMPLKNDPGFTAQCYNLHIHSAVLCNSVRSPAKTKFLIVEHRREGFESNNIITHTAVHFSCGNALRI